MTPFTGDLKITYYSKELRIGMMILWLVSPMVGEGLYKIGGCVAGFRCQFDTI